MTHRPVTIEAGCALRDLRAIAVILAVIAGSALAGWIIGRG